MKTKNVIIISALSLSGLMIGMQAKAQNEVDALRYSFNDTPGTARSLGMGGAFGALGADNSSFWNNPAGLALYKRSTFEFSLGLHSRNTDASYMGNTENAEKNKLNVPSFGYVVSKQQDDRIRTVIGIGVGTIRNFNQNISIEGKVDGTTLLDVFARQANGIHYDQIGDEFPFGAGLAWDTYLIDPLDTLQNTYVPVAYGSDITQSKNINRSGRQSETSFALGVAVDEKLFMGLTLGFQVVNFFEKSIYTESFASSTVLDYYMFSEDLEARGNSINAKLGFIYRASEWLRVGAAWQSPSKMVMSETYSTNIYSKFKDGDSYNETSPSLVSNYIVGTPSKFMANAAFVMGKVGVVSADYEFMNYSRIRMNGTGLSNDYNYAAENEAIRDNYELTHKVKIGMEYRLADNWRVRGGTIYQQSPFVNGSSANTSMITYTGGLGYRKDTFFIDLAGMYRKDQESYWLYDPALVDETQISSTTVFGIVSVGIRY